MQRHGSGHDLGRRSVIGTDITVRLARRLFRGVSDGHREIDAGGNAVWISAHLLGRITYSTKTNFIRGWGRAQWQPAVERRAGQAQHARTASAQPDWRTTWLKRSRLQFDAWLLIPPQTPAAFDGAEHGADAAIARNTKRRQLCMCAWELSAGTDSHDEAAFCNAVECGQGVRHRKGVAEQRQQYGCPERNASRRPGNSRQKGQRFAARARQ